MKRTHHPSHPSFFSALWMLSCFCLSNVTVKRLELGSGARADLSSRRSLVYTQTSTLDRFRRDTARKKRASMFPNSHFGKNPWFSTVFLAVHLLMFRRLWLWYQMTPASPSPSTQPTTRYNNPERDPFSIRQIGIPHKYIVSRKSSRE